MSSKGVIRFLKDWTLPVAMGLGAVLYLLFAFTPQLDAAATVMNPSFFTAHTSSRLQWQKRTACTRLHSR